MTKKRLDVFLVERGFFESRARAQAAILAGSVLVNGQKVKSSGQKVDESAEIKIIGDTNPYVSRGGLKLEGALKAFAFDVKDAVALDVGISTGGFADCLLQHGAKKIYGVDVGYGQLAWKLRQDERVVIFERSNIRFLDKSKIPEPIGIATIDVSFISLTLVIPKIVEIIKDGGYILALIKPQFELSKQDVKRGGVVRDKELQLAAVNKIEGFSKSSGLEVRGVAPSAILGPKGNQEYFILLKKPSAINSGRGLNR